MPLEASELKRFALFSQCTAADLDELARIGTRSVVAKNQTIFSEGDDPGALYIVLSGRVRVFKLNKIGREILLDNLGPGDFFGEMSLFDDAPRSATVQAIEAGSLALFPKSAFFKLLHSNIHGALTVIGALVKRLREADEKLRDLVLVDVYGRVARALIQLCQKAGEMYVIDPAPRKIDVARMIGASRETVSRVMSDLERKGAISSEGDRLVILNHDLLFHHERD